MLQTHIEWFPNHSAKCLGAFICSVLWNSSCMHHLAITHTLVNSDLGNCQTLCIRPKLQMILSCIGLDYPHTWNGFQRHSKHVQRVWEHPYAVEQQLNASSCHYQNNLVGSSCGNGRILWVTPELQLVTMFVFLLCCHNSLFLLLFFESSAPPPLTSFINW